MFLIKNPQFLYNFFFETWSKCPPYELVILTKSQRNRLKNVYFFIKSIFQGHMSILGPHTVD